MRVFHSVVSPSFSTIPMHPSLVPSVAPKKKPPSSASVALLPTVVPSAPPHTSAARAVPDARLCVVVCGAAAVGAVLEPSALVKVPLSAHPNCSVAAAAWSL
jgi:hypothetical protein